MMAVSQVKWTPHNLSATNGIAIPNQEVCRPCHTPHNASSEVGYLWNHELSAGSWTLHDNADQGSLMNGHSRLCLSCHDATIALDSYGGLTGTNYVSGSVNLGSDLSNDHPVGVAYPPPTQYGYNQPDTDGHIVSAETPSGSYAKLAEDGTVQCTSCHYAHGSKADYGMFLRVDNTGSALCMTCHTR
jgi:predicted CXXCH cytochrome family protein